MRDFNTKSEVFEKNVIFIADKLQAEMFKLIFNKASDSLLIKHLEYYVKEIDRIKDLTIGNPRFKWQLLEKEIDFSFKKDKSITGANILFDWEHNHVPNRVLLILKL